MSYSSGMITKFFYSYVGFYIKDEYNKNMLLFSYLEDKDVLYIELND